MEAKPTTLPSVVCATCVELYLSDRCAGCDAEHSADAPNLWDSGRPYCLPCWQRVREMRDG